MASSAFCSGSGEGKGSGETGLTVSPLTFDWKLEEGVRGVGDWVVTLWSARGALKIKIRILDVSKGVAFEAVFDSDALETARMDPRLRFEDNAATVCNALKGEGFAKVKGVLLDGRHAVLSISEEMGHRTFEYRLKLIRTPVTESDTLRLELASSKKQLAIASVEMEIQATDYRNTIEEMRREMAEETAALREAVRSDDAAKQQLAGSKKNVINLSKEIVSLKAAMAETRRDAAQQRTESRSKFAAATKEIADVRAQATAERHTAKRKLDKAKKQIADLLKDAKGKSAASFSGTTFEELLEVNAKTMAEYSLLEQQLAKVKAHSAAECRASDDLRPKIGIDDAPIAKLTDFVFYTRSKKLQVSVNGKTGTVTKGMAQMVVIPEVRTDAQICIVLEKISGFVAVGVIDTNEAMAAGCRFDTNGRVTVKNSLVSKTQEFGGWHSGDRLFVSVNVSSGTVSIRAPNGDFTAKWTAQSLPPVFAVECSAVGDKVRIE